MLRHSLILCACLTLLWAVKSLHAEVPRYISFQGVLTDDAGAPVPDGEYPILFRIFDSESGGGEPLWVESQLVTTVNGVFDVLLGTSSELNLLFDEPYWLETVTTAGTLAPRIQLASTAYSLRSASIDDSVAVRSINGLQDDLTLSTGEGVAITVHGDTLTISAPSVRLSGDASGATTELTANWTSYAELSATVTANGPGVIVCESVVQLQISHLNGINDRVQLCHALEVDAAGTDVAYYSVHSVPAEFPAFTNQEITIPVQTLLQVSEADEYTVYLNGRVTQGQGGDRFWYASLTATFYPDHSVDSRPSRSGASVSIEKTLE